MLEEVGAHGVEPVVVAEPVAEAVEERQAGARARGPWRRPPPGSSVTIGLPVIRSSRP